MITAKFENIGPIKKAKLELGDLTIIAGQNNTGKTYLVYTLGEFLRSWSRGKYNFFKNSKKYPKQYNLKIKEIAERIKRTGSVEITLDEYNYMSDQLTKMASKLFSKKDIHKVFSSSKEEFEKANFQFKEKYKSMKGGIVIRSPRSPEDEKPLVKLSFQDNKLKFEIGDPEHAMFSGQFDGLYICFSIIMQHNSVEPFILSAERFGISLFHKELDFTRNKLIQELQKRLGSKNFNPREFIEEESSRYAMPIQHNIDFTRDLLHIAKKKGKLPMDAVNLVKNMAGGYYKAEKDAIKFISNRRGKNRFEIPLHLASSSARGILDLYFYIRHIAERGQLLIIDEPESHLSPHNQLLMARLLAFCVNSGIKALITTHSDYIIKEINNLIMLHQDFEDKQEFLKKYKKEYTENDRLDPNSVKAYICEEGGLSPCDIDEKGIKEMSVFDDAIDDINLISEELNIYTKADTLEDD